MNTEVIVFDLGGVVFTNGTKRFIEEISDQYAVPLSTVRECIDGELGTLYREAKISRAVFWERVLTELKLDRDIEQLETQWIDGYDLIGGTHAILNELKQHYRLLYLSDNVRERVERLHQRFGFLDWFDDGIFSHEVGVRKPNLAIYQALVQKAAVAPEAMLFIDDKPECLPPARSIGMKGIHFTDAAALRNALTAEGVL